MINATSSRTSRAAAAASNSMSVFTGRIRSWPLGLLALWVLALGSWQLASSWSWPGRLILLQIACKLQLIIEEGMLGEVLAKLLRDSQLITIWNSREVGELGDGGTRARPVGRVCATVLRNCLGRSRLKFSRSSSLVRLKIFAVNRPVSSPVDFACTNQRDKRTTRNRERWDIATPWKGRRQSVGEYCVPYVTRYM